MADIGDAIVQLVTIVGEIDEIKLAPQYPPENAAEFPFLTAFPNTGRYTSMMASTEKKGVHTVQLEIHVTRHGLPYAMEQIWPLGDRIADKILNNPTLGGTVNTVISSDDNPITYSFGSSEWAGVDTLAFIFQVPFKQQTTVDTS